MGAQAFIPPSLVRSQGLERPTRTRGAEAWALILFAGSTFLTLALATARYHADDPTVSGSDWMGAAGAFVAGILIRGFGAAAWWIPMELLFIGAPLLRGKRPDVVGLRLAGDLLILVLTASLLQVAMPEWEVFGQARSGGNVGLFFGELMRGLFSAPGSFLVGLTGIGLILIGRSSFSFIQWCERVVVWYRLSLVLLVRGARALGDVWKRASDVRATQSALRRQEPSIAEPDPDAAILHHLESDTPWIPLESTGAPPLAVSESLKRKLNTEPAWEQESSPSCEVSVENSAGGEAPRVEPESKKSDAAASEDGFWQGITEQEESEHPAAEHPADAEESHDAYLHSETSNCEDEGEDSSKEFRSVRQS